MSFRRVNKGQREVEARILLADAFRRISPVPFSYAVIPSESAAGG
jgi:hypothetical protein